MSLETKKLIAGRTSAFALAGLVLAIIAACFMLARRADAQAPAAVVKPISYGPLSMVPAVREYNGIYWANLTMYLPGFPKVKTPFRVEAITNDGAVILPLSETGTAGNTIVYVSLERSQITTWLQVMDGITGAFRQIALPANTSSELVTVRILPAVTGNGSTVLPVSTGMIIQGTQAKYYEDNTLYNDYYQMPISPSP